MNLQVRDMPMSNRFTGRGDHMSHVPTKRDESAVKSLIVNTIALSHLYSLQCVTLNEKIREKIKISAVKPLTVNTSEIWTHPYVNAYILVPRWSLLLDFTALDNLHQTLQM